MRVFGARGLSLMFNHHKQYVHDIVCIPSERERETDRAMTENGFDTSRFIGILYVLCVRSAGTRQDSAGGGGGLRGIFFFYSFSEQRALTVI